MYTVFETYRSEADWMALKGQVILSWAILNPNGPTINCVGFAEGPGQPGQSEIFWRWMHFLGGESYCLGYVDNDSENFLIEICRVLSYALTLEQGTVLKRCPVVTCVPSFFLQIGADEWNMAFAQLLGASRAFREADWGREQYYLSKYGHQFFSRAGEELREAVEMMRRDPEFAESEGVKFADLMHQGKPEYDEWQPNQYESRALQIGDIEAWCNAVTAREFQAVSLAQLAQMWVGSSLRVAGYMPAKETLEQVREFLEHFGHPYWPAEWTTESLAESMGLKTTSTSTSGPTDAGQPPQTSQHATQASLRERLSRAIRGQFGSRARH